VRKEFENTNSFSLQPISRLLQRYHIVGHGFGLVGDSFGEGDPVSHILGGKMAAALYIDEGRSEELFDGWVLLDLVTKGDELVAVEEGLAEDFWSVTKKEWVDIDEFKEDKG
jgi:hypothetical protein